ncbi:MAG: ABC-2 family transporter protein [Tissierellia bacterium]|nr:ABC-2 family transporter protein [Tissierellia bacterium]
MNIYKAIFRAKKMEFTAYRSNVYLNFFFGCVPLFLYILLWRAIYGNGMDQIGGYTLRQMITYYVMVFLLSNVFNARENTVKLAEMIRDGSIHNHMLKPIGFFTLNVQMYGAEKMLYLLNISLPFIGFCWLIHPYIYWEINQLGYFLLSVIMAFGLKYLMGCILGLLTTWIEEISGLLDLWGNIEGFLSGKLFPLSILPKPLFAIVTFLPFQYMLYVPLDIYMGNLRGAKMMEALMIQGLWLVILTGVLMGLKKKAFQKYTGYGA